MNTKTPCSSGSCAVSRRRFVQLSTLGALAAGAARAQEETTKGFKGTKEQAGYIEKDQPGAQSCSTCHSYIEPAECQLVEGPVSPWGWCVWFSD